MVERRLGRGLDFFLSRGDKGDRKEPGAEVADLEIASLRPNPFQPRREFDETALNELAASIKANGLIQPIVVRRTSAGPEIVSGERRWRAAKIAGLDRIPAIVRDVSDDTSAVMALVENVQRTDLNPIDKAYAFQRLAQVTGERHDEIARRLGLDRSTIANFVRLLDLTEDVRSLVARGTLSMGHARAMVGLTPEQQAVLASVVVRDRLSVREVEARVQALKAEPTSETHATAKLGKAKARPVWVNEIEDTLAETLNTPVRVRYGRKRALIAIECRGRQEFERVYDLLKSVPSEPGEKEVPSRPVEADAKR